MPTRPNPRQVAIFFASLVAILLAVLASYRTPVDRVIADEGPYLAMIESLQGGGV